MRIETFVQRSRMPASAEEVFRWHQAPDALARLTPPGAGVQVVEAAPSLEDGTRAVLRVRVMGFWRTWVAVHEGYVPGRRFADRQVEGPFAHWLHTHRVEPVGPDACLLEDRVEWALPLGALGRWLGGWHVRRTLRRTFAWRHAVTAAAVARDRGTGR